MRRETAGGVLLILVPVLMVLIMLMHPTGQDIGDTFAQAAAVNRLVHGTAIVAVPLVFLGLLSLSRRLGHSDIAVAGLVAYGVAVVAWLSAGVASGFVQTELFGAMREAGEAESTTLRTLSHFTYAFNQSFAAVGVVASAVAIGLLLAQASGYLSLDVGGFGAVILVQSAWFVGSGIDLLRGRALGASA